MAQTALLIAALTTFSLGAVHSWLGERRLIQPLLSPSGAQMLERSRFARSVLRFAWHLTSVAWWGIAAILAALAFFPLAGPDRWVLGAVAATFLVTGGLILVTSKGRHLAWPFCIGVAALSAWAILHSPA